ncbi:hypothetical protein O181_017301 [Austropuccinia psidii MF-1]|uniref:Uncharacterized protein n=1 Tax=Austropuccinia psidii MF-1 TaxID=1389203 RepID=A0A9Q3C375_9BASI|nr:hypothetical protein [Austropuccinia psidii MF-1]
MVQGPPGIPAYGSNLVRGDFNNPHGQRKAAYEPYLLRTGDHRSCKRPKGTKKSKKSLNPNMIKNSHSDGQDAKQSRWSKVAQGHFQAKPQGQWGQDPSLDRSKVKSGWGGPKTIIWVVKKGYTFI